MTDEVGKDSVSPETGKSDTGGQAPEGGDERILGRFKSVDDLAKSYTELEKKLGNWKEKEERLTELQAYQEQVAPVVNFIWNDEDTLKKYRKFALGENAETAVPEDKANQKAPSSPESKEILDVVVATESRIITDFEKAHGFDDLDEEQQASLRKEMGKYIGKWLGTSGRKRPTLAELPDFLEQSFTLASAERIKARAKSEGAAEAYTAQLASGGVFPASSGKKANKLELTAKEKDTARKMGLSEDDYLKGKEAVSKSRKYAEED